MQVYTEHSIYKHITLARVITARRLRDEASPCAGGWLAHQASRRAAAVFAQAMRVVAHLEPDCTAPVLATWASAGSVAGPRMEHWHMRLVGMVAAALVGLSAVDEAGIADVLAEAGMTMVS